MEVLLNFGFKTSKRMERYIKKYQPELWLKMKKTPGEPVEVATSTGTIKFTPIVQSDPNLPPKRRCAGCDRIIELDELIILSRYDDVSKEFMLFWCSPVCLQRKGKSAMPWDVPSKFYHAGTKSMESDWYDKCR